MRCSRAPFPGNSVTTFAEADAVNIDVITCSKSKLRMAPEVMELRPVFIEGDLMSREELVRRGLNPGVHLAIHYDRDAQFDAQAQVRTNGIEPEGMSGGPFSASAATGRFGWPALAQTSTPDSASFMAHGLKMSLRRSASESTPMPGRSRRRLRETVSSSACLPGSNSIST